MQPPTAPALAPEEVSDIRASLGALRARMGLGAAATPEPEATFQPAPSPDKNAH